MHTTISKVVINAPHGHLDPTINTCVDTMHSQNRELRPSLL